VKRYEIDILIIGAGQAGLAVAYYLRSSGLSYLLVDGNERIGDSWRQRYDSLSLFTSRAFSALPGLDLSGDPDGYPTRDEIANYFERYAQHFAFPVHLNQPIRTLQTTQTGFQATTASGDTYQSDIVVIATGAFQKIKVPHVSKKLSPDVEQFTAQSYKNPDQIPSDKVLIVGDGASGRDFANGLSETHEVLLATGRSRRLLPEILFGKNIWWWLDKTGLLHARRDSVIGRIMQKTDPFPARGRRLRTLRNAGVKVLPYLTAIDGNTVHFANGHIDQVSSVIWATGYEDQSDWVEMPDVKDDNGNFIQQDGVSPVDNLYFIGRPWQRTRGSALITGVGSDAQDLVQQIQKNTSASVSKPMIMQGA
jgi:putative flavoprotein involved in K+ transport